MEGDNRQFIWLLLLVISIHSLRMEGDFLVSLSWTVHGISIHSLRMEGDTIDTQTRKIILKFQSTPSAWRETLVIIPFNARFTFQSTPSAWRETRTETALHPSSAYFNPLPPHGGRRPSSAVSSADHSVFQSTPSAWRETNS